LVYAVVDTSATTPYALQRNATATKRGHNRRLADKILVAFHAACDEHALDVADTLLTVVAKLVKAPPVLPAGFDRRAPQDVTEARERLWNLRYPCPWRTNAE
jgi:hypothetical protein